MIPSLEWKMLNRLYCKNISSSTFREEEFLYLYGSALFFALKLTS